MGMQEIYIDVLHFYKDCIIWMPMFLVVICVKLELINHLLSKEENRSNNRGIALFNQKSPQRTPEDIPP